MAESKSQEAVEFLYHVQEVESTNRAEGLQDLKFRFGDQWPAAMIDARGNRPKLTVNETDAYIRQITNAMREQRPRIKAYAANSTAQKKTADVITGLMRHFQVNSDADNAYDLAGEFAVTMGWGYWRVLTDYVREDSFDQDIYIKQIENPFSVYFDTNSNEPDGSDAEKCLLTDSIPLTTFRRDFPGAQDSGFVQTGTGDVTPEWLTKDSIRIAEYFEVERTKAKLVALSNGDAIWADEMPPAVVLQASGITIKGDRDSYKRKVTWKKLSAYETLEEKPWPGRWIPVVPCYGAVMVIEGKKVRMGAVRFARDPQKMVNYWQTNITETMAMAPKPKWLGAEGFDEGHENEWNKANIDASPVLRFKTRGIDGREIPAPQRIAPEPPPEGLITASIAASQNLQRVMGMFDPETNVKGVKSGRAIRAESSQSERSNFHFYDNQTRSMKHTGRICLDLTKHIFDMPRVACIIGDDGKTDLVQLNGQPTAEGQAINEVIHDVRVGEYGVIMDVGPGYNSKRQEAAETLGNILSQDPALMAQIGDLYFRNLDFPGSEVIADRLAANNPLAQIDDKSDVPPQAQMMIKALQDKLQKAMQALQAAGMEIKFKADLQERKEQHEDKRELMRQTTKAHDIEVSTATKRHDVETRALTAQNVEELKGFVQLLLHDKDTLQLLHMAMVENAREKAKADETEPVGGA